MTFGSRCLILGAASLDPSSLLLATANGSAVRNAMTLIHPSPALETYLCTAMYAFMYNPLSKNVTLECLMFNFRHSLALMYVNLLLHCINVTINNNSACVETTASILLLYVRLRGGSAMQK